MCDQVLVAQFHVLELYTIGVGSGGGGRGGTHCGLD